MYYAKSPLNYIGGKHRILKQLIPLFPNKINTFVDLFVGGANVSINVFANRIIANDNLTPLIETFNKFQEQDIEKTLNSIESAISKYKLSKTESIGYYKLREEYNKSRDPIDLFVLVAFAFNHQIRFNNSQKFNTPAGTNRSSFSDRMKKNLIEFVELIQEKKIEFVSYNFDELDLSELTPDDFVYCDPPYLITTATYNDGKRGFTGWGSKEEHKLLKLLDSLDKRKIKFALSNVIEHKGKKNEILINWLNENPNYKMIHIDKQYENSNYQTINSKSPTIEVVIVNYKK